MQYSTTHLIELITATQLAAYYVTAYTDTILLLTYYDFLSLPYYVVVLWCVVVLLCRQTTLYLHWYCLRKPATTAHSIPYVVVLWLCYCVDKQHYLLTSTTIIVWWKPITTSLPLSSLCWCSVMLLLCRHDKQHYSHWLLFEKTHNIQLTPSLSSLCCCFVMLLLCRQTTALLTYTAIVWKPIITTTTKRNQ
jgi:hypothetical protein